MKLAAGTGSWQERLGTKHWKLGTSAKKQRSRSGLARRDFQLAAEQLELAETHIQHQHQCSMPELTAEAAKPG